MIYLDLLHKDTKKALLFLEQEVPTEALEGVRKCCKLIVSQGK